MRKIFNFWLFITIIWIISTAIDRYCWNNLNGIPSWDQADYLNSAMEHGKALGLIKGSSWEGFKSLFDLSPKIPPLASLINGIVIAIAGDSPSQAAWSLSLWNGLLIFSIAIWGICLLNKSFAILSVSFIAITPILLQLRSDYVLELPLTAVLSLTILSTGYWLHPSKGGKPWQALVASLATISSLLIKQSALLVIFPIFIYSIILVLREAKARKNKLIQLISSFAMTSIALLPWLKHNWITFIGGTNRAVIQSAQLEGDPSLLSIENWTWYLNWIPEQIGNFIIIIGISGIILCFCTTKNTINLCGDKENIDDVFLWKWLILILISSWLLTSLSPNKDERYIAPLIPSLILLLSRGWWEWNKWLQRKEIIKRPFNSLLMTISLGVLGSLPQATKAQIQFLEQTPRGPLQEMVHTTLNYNSDGRKKTVIVVPSTPDLNQHNWSYYGQRNGGKIIGRQLGNNQKDIVAVLNQAEWVVLAEGDQGSVRASALVLDQTIRNHEFFREIKRFERGNGGTYSIWKRALNAPPPIKFSTVFPELAKGMEIGPKGLERIFQEIEIQHMVDGHFQYQSTSERQALKKLELNDRNVDAYWTLALLSILKNRPNEASLHLAKLKVLLPQNPWPSAYQIIVELANWNPWESRSIAIKASKIHDHSVLIGLKDLSEVLSGFIWKVPAAKVSINKAIKEINKDLDS